NISYDDGANWNKCNSPAVGQFYYVAVDMAEPYNIYGGLQDNGVWTGPSTYQPGDRWHGTGRYPYRSILGGDGMQVAVDTRDNNTVYTGFQFGFYFRLDLKNNKRKMIRPQHQLGERPLRFNWQTPIHLSKHNQDIFYLGANKLYRSFNQGDDYEAISGDLTKGGKKGDVPFGTLSTIHESDFQFGLLYTGSDDGLVHISKNGGASWENISAGLPEGLWVARVQASSHQQSRVYLALNNYRNDDFTPYLYVSEDYGQNWQRLGSDLPMEPVNVIKEDPFNEDLLYVGTDHGLYVSIDRGQQFMPMKKGLPAVPVHDVVVHPRDRDLIVGTHGRSIYVANVSALQALDKGKLASGLQTFEVAPVYHSSRWGSQRASWRKANEPEVRLPVFS
ncbi:MAG: glycosyl hydrolase, partial [Bacteroidota bacterium]